MSDRPWYKRYGSDFIAGTLGMTLEEKGAYSIVIDLIYDRGGPVPDDPRYIAGVCGCSVRKWNSIRDRLLALGKITIRDGSISNSRADKELENSSKNARERAESGRKGGRKRAEKAREPRDNSDLAQVELKHTRAFQKPETRDSISSGEDIQAPASPPTPRDELAAVLDGEHVQAVLDHRKGFRGKFTAKAAQLLAREFAKCDDPNAAADEMLRRNWQGFRADWMQNGHGRSPPNGNGKPRSGMMDEIQRRLSDDDGHPQGEDSGDWGSVYPRCLPAAGTGRH